jgi:ABC-type nitrate/sulfonate/bicarbonate transport system permease component
MKKSVNIEHRAAPLILSAVLLIIWQAAVDFGLVQRFILPSPTDIVTTLFEILPAIKGHIAVTVFEASIGFAAAIILSLVLAILMDSVEWIRKALYPLIVVSQTVPIIALAPLFVIWFGFGTLPKVIVVILVCFFPIVVSLLQGLSSADREMVNLLKSMGASKVQIFKMVKFPGALVSFFSGLRIAATYSIMGAIIGEWLGGAEGLGIYMLRVKNTFALDKVFAVIVVIVLLSMSVFKIIEVVEYLATPWRRSD